MTMFKNLFETANLSDKVDLGNGSKGQKGMYKINMSKADKTKGYRAKLRFLPNLEETGKNEDGSPILEWKVSNIKRIFHYVKMDNNPELNGFYDSPRNFKERCLLSTTYTNLNNSNNAVLKERTKSLQLNTKYYSYVLVLEDSQQPELVGKVLIFEYGKVIFDKIESEFKGEYGDECNVFSLTQGKDFFLLAKEIKTGNLTYPDYSPSKFMETITSIPIAKEMGDGSVVIKNAKLESEDALEPSMYPAIVSMLLKRELEISTYEPKPLTKDDLERVTKISNILMGRDIDSYEAKHDESVNAFDISEESSISTFDEFDGGGDVMDDDFFGSL